MKENDHHREVYAYFGLAVYHAQVLESGLINALVMLDFFPNNVHHIVTKTDWSGKFDAFFDGRAALTMGNLISALRKITPVPDDLEQQLKAALEKRKFLVHHYFRENIVLFATAVGREQIIEDFKTCIDVFMAADRRLESIVAPMNSRFGLTAEKIDALVREMIAKQSTVGELG